MNFGIGIDPLGATLNLFGYYQQNKWSSRNYALQQQAQEEAKFMNRNQLQVQAADALKAGINPLAMSGGSVSSASASPVQAPDISQLAASLAQSLQIKHEDKMQDKQLAHETEIMKMKLRHEEMLAAWKNSRDKQLNQSAKDQEWLVSHNKLQESKRQFDVNMEELKRHNQATELNASDRLAMDKNAQEIMNSLRVQQGYLNSVELRQKCRELASNMISGYSNNNSGLMGWLERLGIKITNIENSFQRKPTTDGLAEILFNALKDGTF